MPKFTAIVFSLAALVAFGGTAAFAAPALTGEEVMRAVYERPTPNTIQGELTMTLRNARGAVRERRIRQFIRDEGGTEKKILFFLAPADVRDTSFMNFSYDEAGRDDDQWIYLPALRRVKRIAGDSKNDSFMGSDFTYDDLGARHPEEDTHRLLRAETLRGRPCLVVESVPRAPGSAYGRTVTWVAEGLWIGLQKEFYDREGTLLKVLSVEAYEEIEGFQTVTEMVMENRKTGHSTRLQLRDLVFNADIPDSHFSERMMQRGIR